jgi:hypothetical protein
MVSVSALRALSEKWRERARMLCRKADAWVGPHARVMADRAECYDRCADELDALLATAQTPAQEPEIDCPFCGEGVKQVASATLSIALWQHTNWACRVVKEFGLRTQHRKKVNPQPEAVAPSAPEQQLKDLADGIAMTDATRIAELKRFAKCEACVDDDTAPTCRTVYPHVMNWCGLCRSAFLLDQLTASAAALAEARQEIAAMQANHTRRWNVAPQEDGAVWMCRGEHDKALGCEWETFVPDAALASLRAEHETLRTALVLACEFITAEQWQFMKAETKDALKAALLASPQEPR